MRVGVVGAGAWGTTLASIVAAGQRRASGLVSRRSWKPCGAIIQNHLFLDGCRLPAHEPRGRVSARAATIEANVVPHAPAPTTPTLIPCHSSCPRTQWPPDRSLRPCAAPETTGQSRWSCPVGAAGRDLWPLGDALNPGCWRGERGGWHDPDADPESPGADDDRRTDPTEDAGAGRHLAALTTGTVLRPRRAALGEVFQTRSS